MSAVNASETSSPRLVDVLVALGRFLGGLALVGASIGMALVAMNQVYPAVPALGWVLIAAAILGFLPAVFLAIRLKVELATTLAGWFFGTLLALRAGRTAVGTLMSVGSSYAVYQLVRSIASSPGTVRVKDTVVGAMFFFVMGLWGVFLVVTEPDGA